MMATSALYGKRLIQNAVGFFPVGALGMNHAAFPSFNTSCQITKRLTEFMLMCFVVLHAYIFCHSGAT